MDKRALRKAAFARIRALSPEEKQAASIQIGESLRTHPRWTEVRSVFSFLPLPSEPDLTSLFLDFPEKSWGFSRVSECGERLHFHEVSSEEQLRKGEFGFLEPNPEQCPEIHEPDWILIPGVGFSPSNLARLGRGKGHYDRFLAPQRARNTPPRLIGIGFETQLIQIEPESHDIAMDTVLTEAGWATEFQ